MNVSRRKFVALGAGLALGGCDGEDSAAEIRRWVGKPEAPALAGPLSPPAGETLDEISHLLSRLTFGARPGDYARASALGAAAYVEEQLAPEKLGDGQCERLLRHEFAELEEPTSRLFARVFGRDDPIRQIFPTSLASGSGHVGELYEFKEKKLLEELTRARLLRAVLSRRQLYEVMVEFWSDHFNIDPSKGECRWLKAADDRAVIRQHALGNFTDLVRASALSPAMLWYLDGRVNARRRPTDKPNENYARELMELHTMGVYGGYSQQDVMEVARCLTGWTVRDKKQWRKGQVEFRPERHDDGAKTVLGHPIPAGQGLHDLDRVLQILTSHPATAEFLATKLCRRFIADEPPPAAIRAVAEAFTRSGGEIRDTLRALFGTPEFAQSRGTKLKRPFHFVVSALRAVNARTDGGKAIVDALLRMGQAPFRFPTPDGYPEEAGHWMGTLLWRWNFALALAQNQLQGTSARLPELAAALGGEAALVASLLGRQPTAGEWEACQASGSAVAVALASPAFQKC